MLISVRFAIIGVAACASHAPPSADASDDASGAPTVVIDTGTVRGSLEGGVASFKGIPYAAPPVGALRWRAPRPAAHWDGIRDATAFGSGCVATSVEIGAGGNQVIGGTEDCLTLNIWTSTTTPASAMPVMVFIHGGFFQLGSSADTFGGEYSYDGAYITAHQPVVVVTINYRLGALGFLASPALTAADPDHRAGNYGLLDQIAALRWVQANIAAFGGDPARVMVFGQSAGGFSVCNVMASPLARGLFSRALIESGGCIAYARAQALSVGAQAEHALGCDTSADVAACMRAVTAEAAATAVPAYSYDYEFSPNVDPGVLAQPLDAIAAGAHNAVPIVVGTTADEIGSMLAAYLSMPVNTDARYKAELEFEYGTALGDRVYARYPSTSYATSRNAFIAARSDSDFTCPARSIARSLVTAQAAPVYRYFYTHTFDEGPYRSQRAAHAFDLVFVFHVFDPETFPTGASAAELQLADDVIGYLTRFAATGDPNGAGATTWPAYDAATDPYLQIDETFAAGTAIHPNLCNFWDAEGF